MQTRSFGRRSAATRTPPRAGTGIVRQEPKFTPFAQVEQPPTFALAEETASEPSVDDELAAWKSERRWAKGLSIIPWRSVYLIASMSFGIASFVLPASVNDWVNWLLYAAAGMSLYAWFKGRRTSGA